MIPIILRNKLTTSGFDQIGCFYGRNFSNLDPFQYPKETIILPKKVVQEPPIFHPFEIDFTNECLIEQHFTFEWCPLYKAPEGKKVRYSDIYFWRWAITPIDPIPWDHFWFKKLGCDGCKNIGD